MPEPIRLLVVDDHTLFRRGLTALLATQPGLQVVGEAGDAGEALRRAAELQPDVVLLDHHLPGVSGVDALQGIRQAAPAARVLMLTMSEDADTLGRALQQGAHGYLLKTVDSEMLVDAIARALRGQSTVSLEMTDKLVSAFQSLQSVPAPAEPAPAADPLAQLSPREREILQEIAAGASNKEIARRLAIAETTVKIHVQHILRKLELSSRVQAAVLLAGRSAGS
ncbi:response regulator [Xenophilus sp.]|jgi:two-component system nitrate/nitrite response regulator NarL|uniref:response regulator n=1 Tax=Xenophilus sp. TaxID=1873499 RepID=UPI0037DC2936